MKGSLLTVACLSLLLILLSLWTLRFGFEYQVYLLVSLSFLFSFSTDDDIEISGKFVFVFYTELSIAKHLQPYHFYSNYFLFLQFLPMTCKCPPGLLSSEFVLSLSFVCLSLVCLFLSLSARPRRIRVESHGTSREIRIRIGVRESHGTSREIRIRVP